MKNFQEKILILSKQAISLMFALIALFVIWHLYSYYANAPQTRDGKIRVDVVTIATEVSGRVAKVYVQDNQNVQRGQILFELDRDRLANAVQHANANVILMKERLSAADREAKRYGGLEGAAAQQDIDTRRSQAQEAAANYRQAVVELELAKINLTSASVRSPVNGVLSNFSLRPGAYAISGQPLLSIVDSDSYHVAGYFEETKLRKIRVGASAEIRIMGEPAVLTGHVSGVAPGIDDRERSTATGTLLANVNPTFTWVRLAQRIPVRIDLDEVPEKVKLIAGRTATITIEEDLSTKHRP